MSRRRVDNDPWRLVQDNEGRIFVDDGEIDRFRLQGVRGSRRGDGNSNFIPYPQSVICLDGPVVNACQSFSDECLCLGSGKADGARCKEKVQPDTLILFRDDKPKAFAWFMKHAGKEDRS